MKNRLILFAAAVCMAGCNKDMIKDPGQYTRIYMPQAVESPAVRTLYMEDTLQSVVFGAAFGGVNAQTDLISLRFGVDLRLVDSFNKNNNTAYLPMPAGSYQLSETETQIRPGQLSSGPLKLRIKTVGNMAPKSVYMLPVSLSDVSPLMPVNEKLRTTYFLISADFREFLRTKWKVVDQSSFESPNSGEKAWDGNVGSSWHTQWKAAKPAHPHSLTVDMDTLQIVHGFYTLPAAVATGNPQNIRMELSADGNTWTDAGSFSFVNTYDKQYAYLANPQPARYYRLVVISSFGNTHFTHVGEWGAF